MSERDGFKLCTRLTGAQGYITKPFVLNDLLKAVEKPCKKIIKPSMKTGVTTA